MVQTDSQSGHAPQRARVKDFAGRWLALSDSAESWRRLMSGKKRNLLLLGTGGNLENLPFALKAIERGGDVYWLEAPNVLESLDNAFPAPDNDHWHKIDVLTALRIAPSCEIFFHNQGLRLAPDFWGPLLARLEIELLSSQSSVSPKPLAWMPGNVSQLLHNELLQAFAGAGYETVDDSPENSSLKALRNLWKNRVPSIVLSINFRGLDSEGHIFEICDALGAPVAVWLVDNPWHVLSGIKYPWWKKANLFVTDPGFIQPLKDYGAQKVFFCPLAAAPHMWKKELTLYSAPPLFAGRSSFPDKTKFFSGLKIVSDLEKAASSLLEKGEHLPDYHWWVERLRPVLWPGTAVRMAGFGADSFSARNRANWVKAALAHGLRIMGDDGWRLFLPNTEILRPADYYGVMADYYAQAECVLNVTSFLLPDSLNQRHFDVWAAGGLLLTDKTRGLDIFPAELTAKISLANPEDFGERLEMLRSKATLALELKKAWRELIFAQHQYTHRLALIEQKLSEK